ncbi:MAG: hypothetical protein ACI9YT_002889 [Halobacteriales archaeon]|jgi:hypothetical protein
MVRRALLVVLLVLLVGCTGGVFSSGNDSPTPTTTASVAGPTPTTTESATAARTTADDATGRIWPDEPIVVAVEDVTGGGRDFPPLVRAALDYWEGNASRYAGYPVEFVLDPDATDPDVEIRIVRDITDCDGPGDTIGCAPYVTARERIDRPVTVQVVAGLSDESTVHVIKHELGHVFGLDHGDAPRDVMAPGTLVTTLPQPNATERAVPWKDDTLTVHVNDSGVTERDAVRDQIRHAVRYYDRGAGGTVPGNVSFEFVDDPERADVVISFPDEMPCGEGDGSCGRRIGVDEDGDGALEYYTRLEISLIDVDVQATGWHVGYWLGFAFGFEEASDWPEPLGNASADERRSDWWNDDARAVATAWSVPTRAPHPDQR